MGVQGWHRVLSEEGWIPNVEATGQQRETSMLMSQEVVDASHPLFERRLVEIPPGSELHVDGLSLCFQVHRVAYERHRQSVLKTNRKKANVSKWKPSQVRHLIPCFLPPDLLTDVLAEFMQVLRDKCKLKVIVYWDGDERYAPPTRTSEVAREETDDNASSPVNVSNKGNITEFPVPNDDGEFLQEIPSSPFKHDTEVFRQSKRMDEWSVLEEYCVHGKVPTRVSSWEKGFPKNRFFIGHVMQALLVMKIPMNFCEEEADSILARVVSGNPNAYILGMDSDYCFFPEANYVPNNTLMICGKFSNLKAMVIRRDVLAESFGIPETLMVELAILMGNDYVSDIDGFTLRNPVSFVEVPIPEKKPFHNKDPSVRLLAFLDLLRSQGAGFQVQSRDADIQESLLFIRKLYDLEDMSNYEKQKPTLGQEPSLVSASIGMAEELSEILKSATIDPLKGDLSVHDAVLRYLSLILSHQEGSHNDILAVRTPENTVLTQLHIQAFQRLARHRKSYMEVDKEIKDGMWRPLWRDVPAVYWIERLLNVIVRNVIAAQTIPASSIQSPGELFDPYLYHAYLRIARDKQSGGEETFPSIPPKSYDPKDVPKAKLPVDEFQETILQSVRKNRVTIIQGDTGCGKSSRIPIMLLNAPPPNPMQAKTKLFISQPRRIAAKALVERLRAVEPDLKDQIALRMGHGVREYETSQTRAWFVTTGYLVRLLANHPEKFKNISVLIIDEVHERSVDTDVLCLLSRRLLSTNEHIRLVLMSATLAANMYQQYFGVPEPPIRVGARLFPIKEVFLDDLKKESRLSSTDSKRVTELLNECLAVKCNRAPSYQYLDKMYQLVANLATVVAGPNSSVLIFVPGMNEILAITDLVESITIPGRRFTCVPIHSDIPFEDQMMAFDASKNDEVKVVIATNAAESSLTLPEVDNVICLGLCKQIVYNPASHRQMLTPTWISKASATQRAGRTGRVRPGTVYRMYARESYVSHMEPFEKGEMLRIPLDSVILMMKDMLSEEQVRDVLLTCLEPPDISSIDRSFESLYKSHFISSPDDSCQLTNLGSFVSSLGIDLALGSLIGLGIQMGVGAEAVQMAAILSFPKSPWVMSNHLIHPTTSFNENTCKSFVSRCHFDANLFSEPLALMNLVWEYERLNPKDVQRWSKFHNIFLPRMRRLASTTVNLRKRVADFFGLRQDVIQVDTPPAQMPHAMLTLLRLIQVWVFHDSMIECNPKSLQTVQKKCSQNVLCIELLPKSDTFERSHLEQILLKDRHTFSLIQSSEIRQKGDFEYMPSGPSSGGNFNTRLEAHTISYATEKQIALVCISFQYALTVYIARGSPSEDAVVTCLRKQRKEDARAILHARSNEGKSARGIGERSCGLWAVEEISQNKPGGPKAVSWSRFSFALPKTIGKSKKQKVKAARDELVSISESLKKLGRVADHKSMLLHFPWSSEEISPNNRFKFTLSSFGTTSAVNEVDMRDMLGPGIESTTKQIAGKQVLQFPYRESKPRAFKMADSEAMDDSHSSWNRPLIKCIPEGARVVSVLLNKRRREAVVKLLPTKGGKKANDNHDDDGNDEICLFFDKAVNLLRRWKRFNTDNSVFLDAESVPATAMPMENPADLYCVCANTLEVQGGGLRAEGLTLLPQGRAFLLLARFTFGLFQQENVENGTLTEKALLWIGKQSSEGLAGRIEKAVDFHQSAMDLGETLECFPDKVALLLEVLNGVDGYEATPWDALDSNPFIHQNLIQHQRKLKKDCRRESSLADGEKGGGISQQRDERKVANDKQVEEQKHLAASSTHLKATSTTRNEFIMVEDRAWRSVNGQTHPDGMKNEKTGKLRSKKAKKDGKKAKKKKPQKVVSSLTSKSSEDIDRRK